MIVLINYYPGDKTQEWFKSQSLSFYSYNLFDIGVTDINNDNNLDLFTTNHNSLGNLMIGDGDGKFTNVVSQWKFGHNADFPGFADSERKPTFDAPGLYIFWYKRTLLLKAFNTGNNNNLSGQINILSKSEIQYDSSTKVTLTANKLSNSAVESQISFQFLRDGKLEIKPRGFAPISLLLNQNFDLSSVYIGLEKIHPKTHDIDLKTLRDHHSISWADYNGDGNIDAFITRSGGSFGSEENFRQFFNRHLLLNNGKNFEDVTRKSGISDSACRSHTAAWVDFDGNNSLELYVVCFDGTSRLYQQNIQGKFIDIAPKVGLSPLHITSKQRGWGKNGSFVWLDTDNDGDIDLLRSYKNYLMLYINQSGIFEEKKISSLPKIMDLFSLKFSVADYDLDGDLDILAVSGYGNTLLTNVEGEYALTDPKTIGLPDASFSANWVDYNNDGLPDLHDTSEGLYYQLPNHHFKKAHILSQEFRGLSFPLDPRTLWFDFDNSGSQDLLMTALVYDHWKSAIWNSSLYRSIGLTNDWLQKNFHPYKEYQSLKKKRFEKAEHSQTDFVWQGKLYRNINTENHWLKIKLIGPPKNPQALGAKVFMSSPDGEMLQQVGSMEHSHYSQGHRPLHFGLGQAKIAQSVQIFWPDGQSEEIKIPKANKLLIIKWKPKTNN
ncbi:MAG: CRTAC1 family protein [Crocosphaera sp.]|nr:CRTAC1 family protein [Crocosphaera sp.]